MLIVMIMAQIINVKEMRRRLSEAELDRLPLPELSRRSDILQDFHLRTVTVSVCLSVCLTVSFLCLFVYLSVCVDGYASVQMLVNNQIAILVSENMQIKDKYSDADLYSSNDYYLVILNKF